MMMSLADLPENYVSLILGGKIRLEHVTEDLEGLIVEMGGKQEVIENRPVWVLNYESDQQLAQLSERLNKEGVLFAGGPAGWPPAEIFDDLRMKGLLHGSFKEVTWTGPGKWFIRDR